MTSIASQPGSVTRAAKPRSKAWRNARERVVTALLVGCAVFSILVTLAIVVVLASETGAFFAHPGVSVWEFLTGTNWAPLLGTEKHFGILPLVSGTLLVTGVAGCVAMPTGLVVAIYLSEYAPRRARAIIKPMLELLAGIPTVVYGYFALVVITPLLQKLGHVEVYNVLSAGIAVGIMCLPIVCSLSEDALRAVPRSLREGAFAVGATRLDVSVRVVTPAALSGIIAAFLLALARAIGETMIVALAAGGLAHMMDPLHPIDALTTPSQTMTAFMVQVFLGDAASGGVEYLSCYAVASVLFVMTFILTVARHMVMKRYREAYA